MTNARSSRSAAGPLSIACAALLLAACGGQDPAAALAAAPRSALSSGADCEGTDVHTKHLNLFACVHCHPTGATFGFDAPYTFAGGTTTAGGTITRVSGQPTSCSVACHFPKGAPAKSVSWATPGPLACADCHAPAALPAAHPPVAANATREDCQACHVTTGHLDGAVALKGHEPAWSDPASPQFHAATANAGLADCQGCHGADLSGGRVQVSCASCHDGTLAAAWNCVMCHGGTDDASGAPPKATWGNAGDPVRVGAHRSHLASSALSPGFDCSVCHVKPADALAGGHVDASPAEVRFAGTATAGVPTPTPAWNRADATCAATYCHGATMEGGTNRTPTWTAVGQGQAACGSCHGLPPPAPHYAASGLASCAPCHSLTMDAAGALIAPSAGGKHLDGMLQATGGHPEGWMDPAGAGFHAYAANRDLAGCASCHGPNLDGVGGSATTSCATCHGPTWRTSCTMCHGGVDGDQAGAPPAAIWGREGDPAHVGAHRRHLAATLTTAVACGDCHRVPAEALSAGHVDGSAVKLVFGGRATLRGAQAAWDAATGRCSATYCHGNYSGTYTYMTWDWSTDSPAWVDWPYAGKRAAPGWSDGPTTCASCHGNPPADGSTWHSGFHGDRASHRECQLCHPTATSVNGVGTAIADPSLHVNGVVDVVKQSDSTCLGCH